MEYLTKLAQNTLPTLHACGQEYVHAWQSCKHGPFSLILIDSFRLFELSEDVYARSVLLVIFSYSLQLKLESATKALGQSV